VAHHLDTILIHQREARPCHAPIWLRFRDSLVEQLLAEPERVASANRGKEAQLVVAGVWCYPHRLVSPRDLGHLLSVYSLSTDRRYWQPAWAVRPPSTAALVPGSHDPRSHPPPL
jgi:hypothetical protein